MRREVVQVSRPPTVNVFGRGEARPGKGYEWLVAEVVLTPAAAGAWFSRFDLNLAGAEPWVEPRAVDGHRGTGEAHWYLPLDREPAVAEGWGKLKRQPGGPTIGLVYARSDGSSSFVLSPQGQVFFPQEGLVPISLLYRVPAGTALEVKLDAPPLPLTGALRVKVSTPTLAPAQGVVVRLHGVTFEGDVVDIVASTDSDGTCAFEGLPPARYTLVEETQGCYRTERQVDVWPGGSTGADSMLSPMD